MGFGNLGVNQAAEQANKLKPKSGKEIFDPNKEITGRANKRQAKADGYYQMTDREKQIYRFKVQTGKDFIGGAGAGGVQSGTTGNFFNEPSTDYADQEADATKWAENIQSNKSKKATKESKPDPIKFTIPKHTARRGAYNRLPRDLRYPYSTINDSQDFLKFSIFEYTRPRGYITRNQNELKSNLLGNIILPIPAQLVDSNTTDYGQGSMNFITRGALQGASDVISGEFKDASDTTQSVLQSLADNDSRVMIKNFFASKAVQALTGQSLGINELTARASGQVLNPNMELLFKGPTLRSFNYQFKLTPRFQKEAETIRTIIKAFKRNMAPKGAEGTFLKTPNIFQLQYLGKAKNYLNKMKLCALKTVSVNYTGEGTYATYHDGSPISMLLTLSFTELVPIYDEDYEGYYDNSDGVGY